MRNKSSDGQEEVFWSLDCKTEAEDFIRFTSLYMSLRMMDQRFLFLYIMYTASKNTYMTLCTHPLTILLDIYIMELNFYEHDLENVNRKINEFHL